MPISICDSHQLSVSLRSAAIVEEVRLRLLAAGVRLQLCWPIFILEQMNQMPQRYADTRPITEIAAEFAETIGHFGPEIRRAMLARELHLFKGSARAPRPPVVGNQEK